MLPGEAGYNHTTVSKPIGKKDTSSASNPTIRREERLHEFRCAEKPSDSLRLRTQPHQIPCRRRERGARVKLSSRGASREEGRKRLTEIIATSDQSGGAVLPALRLTELAADLEQRDDFGEFTTGRRVCGQNTEGGHGEKEREGDVTGVWKMTLGVPRRECRTHQEAVDPSGYVR